MATTYSISDISKRLDVPIHRIAYLYTTRSLPEPMRVGHRRLFSDVDARRIAKALGLTWEPDRKEANE